jgi:hypothetical protein
MALHPHRELIQALGDRTKIAAALGVKPSRVGMWNYRGVAWRYRPAVARLASERGVKLPQDFWDERVRALPGFE